MRSLHLFASYPQKFVRYQRMRRRQCRSLSTRPRALADEVENENAEGVWGYLMPLDDKVDSPFVLKKREGCAADDSSKQKSGKKAPSGYLVGRHPECGQCEHLSKQRFKLLTHWYRFDHRKPHDLQSPFPHF